MAAPGKKRANRGDVVWDRSEPVRRPAPVPLTREEIVRASLAIAREEGIDAVSLRNVANALQAGPMRLYGYVSSKEELLELLVDEVYGEMVAEGPIKGPWRVALRAVAHRLRRAGRAHLWFTGLLSGRPHLGPNALAHLEMSLSAIAGPRGFEPIDAAVEALRIVSSYAIGAIETEANELRAERATGMDEKQWQDSTWPYVQRQLETGRFPTIARVVQEVTHASPDVAFDRGLECVLDGLVRRRGAKARRRLRAK